MSTDTIHRDVLKMRREVNRQRALKSPNNHDISRLRASENLMPLTGSDFDLTARGKTDGTYAMNLSHKLIHHIQNLDYDTGSSGGWLVPDGTTYEEIFLSGQQQTDPLRREATIITEGLDANSGIAVITDNVVGSIVQPNKAATPSDPVFGLRRTNPHKYTSGAIKMPQELLRDGGQKVVMAVTMESGRAISRKQAQHFATGTGDGTPVGFANVVSSVATSGSATSFTVDDILNLVFGINPAYWDEPSKDPCFMAHASVWKFIFQLKDGNGRPEFLTSGLSLFGRMVVNNALPSAMTASSNVLWFGSFKDCIVIHDTDNRLVTYDETTRENDCMALQAFQSSDAFVVDPSAVGALTLHA